MQVDESIELPFFTAGRILVENNELAQQLGDARSSRVLCKQVSDLLYMTVERVLLDGHDYLDRQRCDSHMPVVVVSVVSQEGSHSCPTQGWDNRA